MVAVSISTGPRTRSFQCTFCRDELEAPMGLAAFGFQLGALRVGQLERGAVIDGRLARRHLALAAAVQFGRGLVTGIKPARGLQPFGGCRGRRISAVGLAGEEIVREAQPVQIFDDRGLQIPAWSARVGVVDAQQEFAARLAREQLIEQRRAGIADMQQAGGRRREADDDAAHHRAHPGNALVMG